MLTWLPNSPMLVQWLLRILCLPAFLLGVALWSADGSVPGLGLRRPLDADQVHEAYWLFTGIGVFGGIIFSMIYGCTLLLLRLSRSLWSDPVLAMQVCGVSSVFIVISGTIVWAVCSGRAGPHDQEESAQKEPPVVEPGSAPAAKRNSNRRNCRW